ncbi:MAG: IS200/IS605 family transposase [Verrucomicrobiae bacterium]|nr:IS200/IS605 family transposase [Verrucomicrobiae bacterium]MCP5539518.1 IS200/IS605 family transposase [Akkermansiaceae bacterium]MCP5550083.1 IS200/IS605 family transposase [Akkermansiaceae bacterium]
MASTFTQLHYHCVWSTKNRQPLISQNIEKSVWAILGATAKAHGMRLAVAGGIENHVHVLLEIPKTLSVSEAMKRLKGGSSNSINEKSLTGSGRFGWQDGCAAFTVSASRHDEVRHYIENQREHHRKLSFEDELVAFLERHRVDFDPKYLWG